MLRAGLAPLPLLRVEAGLIGLDARVDLRLLLGPHLAPDHPVAIAAVVDLEQTVTGPARLDDEQRQAEGQHLGIPGGGDQAGAAARDADNALRNHRLEPLAIGGL